MSGKRVCLIDADLQGSLTVSLGYSDPDNIPQTLASIMMDIINEEDHSTEYGMFHHEEAKNIVSDSRLCGTQMLQY